jgi:putative secretion ATPase (PEP-CTERM system associated)
MYHKYYNFTGRPFRLNPDPRFFFSSKTHKRALSYLRYGIEQGEGFIVITGDVGTGKTTLVSRLIRSLRSDNIITAHIVNSHLHPVDLLRMASAEFQLPYNSISKAALLKNLEGFFISGMEQHKRVLLIVDEAQNLTKGSLEELRMLSNLHRGGRQLLQSFLLGQKEFKTMIRGAGFEQLRQRVIATYHLRPLDIDETRDYIQYRLKVVGWVNNPRIDESVYEGIFRHTSGIPRKINLLSDRILLYGSIEELSLIDQNAFDVVMQDVIDEYWSDELSEEEVIDDNDNLSVSHDGLFSDK